MKKTLSIVLGACMCVATVNAQPFKQAGKENNLQLLFAPMGSNPISLNNGGIMYRKFMGTGNCAIRLGLSVGSEKSTDIVNQEGDTNSFPTSSDVFPSGFFFPAGSYTVATGKNPETESVNKTFWFSIRPGFEKHFAGTDRLSPYVGAEIVFMKSTTKWEKDTLTQGNYTVGPIYDTTSTDITVSAPWNVQTLNQKYGSTTFGINLIAGFDYYFTKNLSLGAELTFGYSSTKYSDLESEYVKNTLTETETGPDINGVSTYNAVSTNSVTSNPDQKQGKTSGFGPGVVAKIKLGWLF